VRLNPGERCAISTKCLLGIGEGPSLGAIGRSLPPVATVWLFGHLYRPLCRTVFGLHMIGKTAEVPPPVGSISKGVVCTRLFALAAAWLAGRPPV